MSSLKSFIRQMVRLPHKGTSFLFNVAIISMSLVVLFVSLDAVIQAYRDLHCATQKVGQTVESIRTTINSYLNDNSSDDQLTYVTDMYMACLDERSTDEISMGMFSFLFQLFSALLISLGVYLLNTSKKNLDDAKSQLDKINKSLETSRKELSSQQESFLISGKLHTIHQLANLLRISTSDSLRGNYTPQLRELVDEVHDLLSDLSEMKRGICESQFNLMLDLETRAQTELKKMESPGNAIETIIEKLLKTHQILNRGKFVENYNAHFEHREEEDKSTNK
jgi:hypothetical protein